VIDRVYAVLRRRAALDWWIGRTMPMEDVQDRPGADRRRIIAGLVLLEGWSADRIAGSFDGGTYRPEQLTDIERAMAKALEGNTLLSPSSRSGCGWNFPNGSATACIVSSANGWSRRCRPC